MHNYIGIAMVIFAIGIAVLSILMGVASIIWAKRCHPKNPAFRHPAFVAKFGQSLLGTSHDREGG